MLISYKLRTPFALGDIPHVMNLADAGTHFVSYGVKFTDLCRCSMSCGASWLSIAMAAAR